MDDLELHDDELDLDDSDIEDDGDTTPDDTNEDKDSEDDRKANAAEVREKQKQAWLQKLKGGKRTLEDMPSNLEWLKKDPEFDEFRDSGKSEKTKRKVEDDEVDTKVQKALKSERDKEEFSYLVGYLEDASEDIDAETMANIQEEYESLLDDGVSKNRALKISMRSNGIKDVESIVAERRKKGLLLPPRGNRKRKVLKKGDDMTEMEKKFSDKGTLPPGFRS